VAPNSPYSRVTAWPSSNAGCGPRVASDTQDREMRFAQRSTGPPNKRMQLTKVVAVPVLQAEVPPCAPAGETDGGTASQLIRRVRWTMGRSDGAIRPD
jgi:hypothetical protein